MAEWEGEEQDQSTAVERTNRYRDQYKAHGLRALVMAMKEAKFRKEEAEAELKEINAEYDVLRFELIPTKMDEEGVERVAYDGIGRVSLTADLRVSNPAPMRQEFFKWLRSKKLGSLITETVNSSTLKAWVKERMKNGKEVPSDLLKVEPITRASITKG